MKKLHLLFLGLLLLIWGQTMGQNHQRCGTDERIAEALNSNPHLLKERARIDAFVANYAANHSSRSSNGPVNIPVVVHVVSNVPAENISNAQIQGQLQILNNDFNRLNADAANTPAYFALSAGNPQINFCLASRDPGGFFSTGITRTQTTQTTWLPDDSVKSITAGGARAWPASEYLNIWVCNLSGPLGYAYRPGTAPSDRVDGVVVDYRVFGITTSPQYGLGRTLTHEVGHFFDLIHPWGSSTACGTDFCGDTPRANGSFGRGPNFNCPAYPKTPGCPGETAQSEMFMNFMDWVDDGCMNLFSNDQVVRMCATVAPGGSRESLINSIGCQPACTWGLYALPWPTGVTFSSATINWNIPSPTGGGIANTGFNIRYRPLGNLTWTTTFVTAPATTATLTGLASNTTYEYAVQVVCSTGGTSFWAGGQLSPLTFTTPPITCAPDPFEPNNSLLSAFAGLTPGTTAWPMICPNTDSDYFQINNTYLNPDIILNLTALPADYALDLLDANGTLVATSVNPGITPEAINYTNPPVGTYYVRVYSQAGGFSPSIYCALTFGLGNSCNNDGLMNHDIPTAALLSNMDTMVGTICSQLEEDYFLIYGDPGLPDVDLVLTGLGTDYDLRLLDSLGNPIDSSVTASLTDEQISFSTIGTSPYIAIVYSSQGLFHTSNTYKITVTQQDNSGSKRGSSSSSWMDEVEIYPNPAHDRLNIHFEGYGSERLNIELLDPTGRVVYSQTTNVKKGDNQLLLDVKDIAAGSYFLNLEGANQTRATSVIIQ